MQVAERAYDEIVELFARGTPPEELVRFRPSRKAQNRARDLLARNKKAPRPERARGLWHRASADQNCEHPV